MPKSKPTRATKRKAKAKAGKPRRKGYEKYKEGQAAISRRRSAEGREIGPLPALENPKRRAACERSLRLYCETYRKETFDLAWSVDHLKAIGKLEAAVFSGGLFAWAQPRGSGKTSLTEAAIEWAILYGHRRFAAVIGATEEAAAEVLDSIKTEFETNELLLADFPEVVFPVVCLGGLNNRAPGQTLGGKRTRITWGSKEVVFPTVDGSKASGARIRVAGITGRVRGMKFKDAQGRMIRPDFAVGDDPQTDESAASPIQTDERERVLMGAVKGLAGPGKSIAMVIPCTVIRRYDLADRILDRDRHPQFQGERFKMLVEPPANVDMWDQYAELRRESLKHDGKGEEATEFYAENREEMDAGAVVSWPERFDPESELSGLQAAMNLKIDSPEAFAAEYQNEPVGGDASDGVKEYNPLAVAKRTNGSERFVVPPGCTRLTAFFDLGGSVHWYAVVAWNEWFGGAVIDAGPWPRQNRTVFSAADARPSFKTLFPKMTEEMRVFAGLEQVVPAVLGRTYHGAGNLEYRVEKCLIDAGKWPKSVYEFIRQSEYGNVISPSKGSARSTTTRSVNRWKLKDGERRGHHWLLNAHVANLGRLLRFDADTWKSFVFSALTVPMGGHHGLTLWGKDSSAHAMLADHLAAESGHSKTLDGETFDKWLSVPGRTDNHLGDCLVGAAVAASMLGLAWRADGGAAKPKKKKKKGSGGVPGPHERQQINPTRL